MAISRVLPKSLFPLVLLALLGQTACGGSGDGVVALPAEPVELTATLTAADLIARPDQGVNTFANAVNALLTGNT